MARYSVAEAKNNLSKLLDKAVAGAEVTITRRGETVARIVAEKPVGAPIDLEWLDKRRLRPKSGVQIDSPALIRQMRDEGY